MTRELVRAHRDRRHRAGLRRHERLPRRGERHRDRRLDPGPDAPGGTGHGRGREPRRRPRRHGRRQDGRRGHHRGAAGSGGPGLVFSAVVGAITWNPITGYFDGRPITSAIMGAGATRRLSAVRWGVARTIVTAGCSPSPRAPSSRARSPRSPAWSCCSRPAQPKRPVM
ncbi:MAG: Probable low-affinity inorganic phosphate transporter [uncultured Actinomycetospora sp.]|uniref:Probable low-affinity inorganic phosphate transporter n=1 Tax=uncultured Actinomycetospora sp. TaxID=1135996 RepID=A0A6J4K2E5_9PSEU|nr:MAG: Probable low-affinity inorganic phosphate transporter [uncultured Actinomycetospora sp.]